MPQASIFLLLNFKQPIVKPNTQASKSKYNKIIYNPVDVSESGALLTTVRPRNVYPGEFYNHLFKPDCVCIGFCLMFFFLSVYVCIFMIKT